MTAPYWQSADGRLVIYHGRAEAVLPTLPAASVDMVFTSPPYNLGITSGGGFSRDRHDRLGGRKGSKWDAPALAFGYGEHDDAMPWSAYEAWQRDILTGCWRLLNDDGAIFYNHKPRVQDRLLRTPLDLNPGLPVRQILIWRRAGGINFSPTHYLPAHEWIVIFAKPAFELKSRGASGVSDVWDIVQESGSPHPAPFPLALPARAIETAAPRSVLDPFMGSGTTLLAAANAGISAIGVEREERWCAYAAERLSDPPLLAAMRAEQMTFGDEAAS